MIASPVSNEGAPETDGPLQVLGGHALEDEARRASAQHRGEDLVVIERGQGENRRRVLVPDQ